MKHQWSPVFILYGEGLPDVTILRADHKKFTQWQRDVYPAVNRLAKALTKVPFRKLRANWFGLDGIETEHWDITKFPRYIFDGKDFQLEKFYNKGEK